MEAFKATIVTRWHGGGDAVPAVPVSTPSAAMGGGLALAVLAAAAIAALSTRRKKNAEKSGCGKNETTTTTPPFAPCTMKEFILNFLGPDGPQYVLDMSRRMGETTSESESESVSVFRIPGLTRSGTGAYVVTDHVLARKVLEHPKSTKWAPGNQFFRDTTHDGPNMITEEGHRWKHVRKNTSRAFSAENVKLMVDAISSVLDEWIEETLEPAIKSGEGGNIDVLDEMNIITSNVITRAAFDYVLTNEERERTLRNLETCWYEFGRKSASNPLRTFRLTRWAFSGVRKAKRAAGEMYDLCRTMLESYRAKKATKPMPHKLIHLIAEDDEYENDGERIRDMIAYVIAGFDTTANTLAFALREMALRPDVQTELRGAIRSCGESSEGARSACPALKQIVRETLRLYPAAASGSLRQLGKDVAVPKSKYVLPSGSIVFTPYYAIQRDRNIYDDADAFVPGRWENPTDAMLNNFMTFSAGRRNCQGQALANAELHEVLARLCGAYEFEVVEEGKAQSLVLYKPVGTILRVKQAAA